MYECYNIAVKWLNEQTEKNHNTKVVDLLLGQYYYGRSVRKELYFKLIEIGVIS